MDFYPWLRAMAKPIASATTFGLENAATKRNIVPLIKQANSDRFMGE